MKNIDEALMALRPGAEWVRRGDSIEWITPGIVPPTQEEIDAEARWIEIKKIRDALLIGEAGCPVEVSSGVVLWFHTDLYSKTQQIGLETEALKLMFSGADMETPLSPEPWKTMSGEEVLMTAALAMKVATAQKIRDGVIYGIAKAKRQDSSAVTTGWPEPYQP